MRDRIKKLIEKLIEENRATFEAMARPKIHLCPNCRMEWICRDRECRVGLVMLDSKCDTEEVRQKLGGKWLE